MLSRPFITEVAKLDPVVSWRFGPHALLISRAVASLAMLLATVGADMADAASSIVDGLRYDGVYQVETKGRGGSIGCDYFRFYADGTVITISTINKCGLRKDSQKWFSKERSELPRGHVSLQGTQLSFSVAHPDGAVDFDGRIDGNRLRLDSHSRINGYRVHKVLEYVDWDVDGCTSAQRIETNSLVIELPRDWRNCTETGSINVEIPGGEGIIIVVLTKNDIPAELLSGTTMTEYVQLMATKMQEESDLTVMPLKTTKLANGTVLYEIVSRRKDGSGQMATFNLQGPRAFLEASYVAVEEDFKYLPEVRKAIMGIKWK